MFGQFGKRKGRFPEQPLFTASGGFVGLQLTTEATEKKHSRYFQFEISGCTRLSVDFVTVFGGSESTKKGMLKKRGSAATFADKAKLNNSNHLQSRRQGHLLIFAATEVGMRQPTYLHCLRVNALLRSVLPATLSRSPLDTTSAPKKFHF